MPTGIRRRHSKGCPAKDGGRCRCKAGYEASVYSVQDGKKIRKSFSSQGAAISWRNEAAGQVRRKELRADESPAPFLGDAWAEWLEGAKAGTITNQSRKKFKGSTLRSYEQAMKMRVLPKFERHRLDQIGHLALQDFVDTLIARDLAVPTIEVTMLPVRAIYKRAKKRGTVRIDPCQGLDMPKGISRRKQLVTPEEASALIAAVPKESDRIIWATAYFAGLRRGELRALRRRDVDLAAGVIHVEKGWDTYDGEIELKTESGLRKVPIVATLRDMLVEYLAGRDLAPEDRMFSGGRPSTAFGADKLQARADKAWKAAGLKRATLHVFRHGYAALMIEAGIASGRFNPKALSTFMGHASIQVTYDTYGKLMPGAEAEAAALIDSFLTAQLEEAEADARAADAVLAGAQTGAPSAS